MKNLKTSVRPSRRVIAVATAALLPSAGAISGAYAQEGDESSLFSGDEIIVTASPLELPVDKTIVATSVVDKEELARNFQNTIAETISREPGISSPYFNAAASRPIIRGLGDDRVRVLDNGIGSIDASVASPDH
ncbi:MAG: Plug domain-containing protein, partial [Pseudomonadota bacterium]